MQRICHNISPDHSENSILYHSVWHNQVLGYVSIPKTASTLYRSNQFRHSTNTSLASRCEHYFAVIRNPYHRFISGLIEYHKRAKQSNIKPQVLASNALAVDIVNNMMKEFLSNPQQFDEHVETQTYFLHKTHKPIHCIRFETQRASLDKLFPEQYGVYERPDWWNKLRAQPPAWDLTQFDLVTLSQCVRTWYSTDWDLWNKIPSGNYITVQFPS